MGARAETYIDTKIGTVYIESVTTKGKYKHFECVCDCGRPFTARASAVTNGNTTSCGCSRVKHGATQEGGKSRLYNIWDRMKQRCYNTKNTGYRWYGAKGVTVCDEWLNDFSTFEKWANSNGYKSDLTIDKDSLCETLNITPKIYSPTTCEWVSQEENTRRSHV